MMNQPVFQKLSVKDREIYEKYYRLSGTVLTDLTFHCRYAWDNIFKNEYAVIEDCLVLISDGGCYTDPHMLMPLGELNRERLLKILEIMLAEFHIRNWKCKIMGIDEKNSILFDKLPFRSVRLCFHADYSDYLYDATALRTLEDSSLRKKRAHVNRFKRLYPEFKYSSASHSDAEDCLLLVSKWCETKGIDINDSNSSDFLMIRRLFDDFDALDIRGGVIRVTGKVAAFSLGSIGNSNRAYIHFEKADPKFDGAYAVINQMVLQNEFPEVGQVNREEDLGIPGLRKSKRSYHPIALLRKYTCRID